MISKRLTAFFCFSVFILVAASAGAADRFVIKPIKQLSDIRVFSAQGWLTMHGLPTETRQHLTGSYLRGFMDAVQFGDVAPSQTTGVLTSLRGDDPKRLVNRIDWFYEKYPQYQSYSPAVVLVVILPRLAADQDPLPKDRIQTGDAPVTSQDDYIIGPINGSGSIKSLPVRNWLTSGALGPDIHYRAKLAYIRGFLDAVQFVELTPGQTTEILDDLKGLTIAQTTAKIDELYTKQPKLQSYSPAVVVIFMLPRVMGGQSPLPEDESTIPVKEISTSDSDSR